MARPRKPVALKIAEGDQPCRINRAEPPAGKGLGPCPPHLGEVGREAWHRLARWLEPMGVAREPDSEALAMYCDIYERWALAKDDVAEVGLTVTTAMGTLKAHPLLGVIKECQAQMTRLLSQFGMTPASRAGLHVPEEPGSDPLLAFLAGRSPNAQAKAAEARPKAKAKAKPARKKAAEDAE